MIWISHHMFDKQSIAYIETANSLETDSFIQALRRFIARRGPIREIRSDNGYLYEAAMANNTVPSKLVLDTL